MPHDEWLFQIDHMLQAIDDIESYVEGIDREQFKATRFYQHAVLWNVQVLGEAIQYIPESVRERYPKLEWEMIRRTRNIIVHHYEKIDLDVIWEAIQKDLPVLRRQLNEMKQHEG